MQQRKTQHCWTGIFSTFNPLFFEKYFLTTHIRKERIYPKSNYYQEAKNNLQQNALTTLWFITKESRVEVGKSGEKEKREKDKEEKMKKIFSKKSAEFVTLYNLDHKTQRPGP